MASLVSDVNAPRPSTLDGAALGAEGAVRRRLKAGAYAIMAVDRSKKQNAHLVGAGVNRKTGIPFVGTITWKVTLKIGTLSYRSDTVTPKLRGGKVTVS